MIGVVAYTLIEFLNYYLAYRNVFGIPFTKKKWPYGGVLAISCATVMLMLNLQDIFGRDIVVTLVGIFAAMILTSGKKWKALILYPVVFIMSSIINTLASYGLAFLLGISQEELYNSILLTLLAECTGVLVFFIYGKVVRKEDKEEMSLTLGQYMVLLTGAVCFFFIVCLAQGLLWGELDLLNQNKEMFAITSIVAALFFMSLSIWQQITWKKAFQYQMDNEKYQMFLSGQEKHIRTLILEDERRRKLRHDMNAHMLALDNMAENEEWDSLKKYIGQMKASLSEGNVEKYTTISAVDAIVSEWHMRALKQQAEWEWKGALKVSDRVTIFELCTVFSNLLSNAVEAIEKQEERGRIAVKVSNYQERIVISIGNTYGNSMEPVPDGEMVFQTTKEDKVFHGLGLKNVEEIIARHEGSMDCEGKDGWFQVDIVL